MDSKSPKTENKEESEVLEAIKHIVAATLGGIIGAAIVWIPGYFFLLKDYL